MATGVENFGGFGGTGQAEAQTYAEILEQSNLLPQERLRITGEATVAYAAALLLQRGEQELVRLLFDVIRLEVDARDDRFEPDVLWLEVAPEHMSEFEKNVVDKIRDACEEVCKRRGYDLWFAGAREILPEVGPGWRESLRQQVSGGKRPTNHARRIRIEPSHPREDYLTFTNEGELTVYRALRKLQESMPADETIGIFPLAGGRIPGKTWEPDVLVTYKKRAGVLEIDGPHHNVRRAMDTTRDHIWLNAGVAWVDRIPVEALPDPKELEAVLKRFLKRLTETR